jgi:hypothetical protein
MGFSESAGKNKAALIGPEAVSVDHEGHISERVDQSSIIPNTNQKHRNRG